MVNFGEVVIHKTVGAPVAQKNTLRQLIEAHADDPRTPKEKDKELEMAVKAVLNDEEPQPGPHTRKDKLLLQLRYELSQGQEAMADLEWVNSAICDTLRAGTNLPRPVAERLERILAKIRKKK